MFLTGPCLPDPSLGSPLGSVLQTLLGAPQLPLSAGAKTPRAARRFRASVTRGCPRAAGLPRTPRSAAGQAPGDPLCLLSSCPSGPRLTAACLLWPPENTLLERWGPLSKGLAGPQSLRDGWCDTDPRDKECPPQRPQGPLSPGGHPAGVGNVVSSVCKGRSSRLCRWGSLSAPHTWDAAPKAAHTHPKSRGQKEAWRKVGLGSSGPRGSLHPARPQVHPEGQGSNSHTPRSLGSWGPGLKVSGCRCQLHQRNTFAETPGDPRWARPLGPAAWVLPGTSTGQTSFPVWLSALWANAALNRINKQTACIRNLLRRSSTSSRGIRAPGGSGQRRAGVGRHHAPSEVAGATGRKHGVRLRTLSPPFSSEPVTPVNPEAPL